MESVLFAIVFICLFIWYFIGIEFMHIAAMKGHTSRRYFWWTFLLGPVGMTMVIALPDRGEQAVQGAKRAEDQLPEI